jgi:hypothetical protein
LHELRKNNTINWVSGYEPTDKLKLTPPLLVNEDFLLGTNDKVTLKHNLPGTVIQFTLNGKEPDSTNATNYKEPVALDQYTVVKARAVKEGWFTSNTITLHFFTTGQKPDSIALLTKPGKDYKGLGPNVLIDGKKADGDNFRDKGWLGFQDNPAIALFSFKSSTPMQRVTVSYHKNIGSHLMPPASVELWVGEKPDQLKLVDKVTLPMPSGYEPNKVEGIVLKGDNKPHPFYKVVANPVAKLPTWHSGKGKKGWVFLDEVIFQ